MVSAKMTSDMEELILTAPALPLRVYAGACCCLCHGVLRFADLLWSGNIHLTTDALVGIGMRMGRPQSWIQ